MSCTKKVQGCSSWLRSSFVSPVSCELMSVLRDIENSPPSAVGSDGRRRRDECLLDAQHARAARTAREFVCAKNRNVDTCDVNLYVRSGRGIVDHGEESVLRA